MLLLGTRLRRLAVAAVVTAAVGSALWSMHVYMPIAGTHWGMRDAVRRYYQDRQIYGQKLVYYAPRDFHDDWAGVRDHWSFDTFILTGHTGVNRIRVIDTTNGDKSNEIKVTVG